MKKIIAEIEKYLPSWGGYKVIEYKILDKYYYDTVIEADFFNYEPLKIRTTSTTAKHSLEQALRLLKMWSYGYAT